ncbi:MAG: hypothetical protein ACRDRN_05090 [Sciscionella sp.]
MAHQSLQHITMALLTEAAEVYRDSPRASAWLHQHLARCRQPLRIAIAGQSGAGKSTLVNAIVGEQVAPITGTEGHSLPAWYTDGQEPRARVRTPDGRAHEVGVSRRGYGPGIDVTGWHRDQVEQVEVEWPARTLRDLIVIDTPALRPPMDEPAGSPSARRIAADADAIVFLARQPHGSDLPLLWSWQDGRVAEAVPMSTLLVLARADEMNAGRIDALPAARQLARRYRRDPRLRPLCQQVVAVSALLAAAGRTLTEWEFQALAALAAMGRTELERVLLSADRFAGTGLAALPDAGARQALLARFGLSGLRLTATLIRQGCDNRAALAAQLVQRSGLSELRESISAQLVHRGTVLKARTALVGLEVVLRREPRAGARGLAAQLDGVLAGAHEFRELRLLAALRTGRTTLPPEWDSEAMRLIGGLGCSPAERFGIEGEAGGAQLRELIMDALARWHEHAESPVGGVDLREAADTVLGSCEIMLRDLPAATVGR